MSNELPDVVIVSDDAGVSTLDPVSDVATVDPVSDVSTVEPVSDVSTESIEEVVEADLLLHVIDSTSPEALQHAESVDKVLKDLGVEHTSRILVLNKIDALSEEQRTEAQILFQGYSCSAATGEGLMPLMEAIESQLFLDGKAHSTEIEPD